MVDTQKEAVEAFIQSTLKDHVLSEGMPRTRVDTQDAYAVAELLRSFLEKVEALEARVAAADKLFDKLNGKYVDYTLTEALAAYEATKEPGE